MKNLRTSLTAVAIAITMLATQVQATNTNLTILSDSAWQEIEETTELENMMEVDEIPALKLKEVSSMHVDFLTGNFTNLQLDAPFELNEEVGLVVFDSDGVMVHSASGTYADLQELHFKDYFFFDMTYIVKMYSAQSVYETRVQVVYR
jgi:hypothetical protein